MAAELNSVIQANRTDLEQQIQLAVERREKTILEKISQIIGRHGLDPAFSRINLRSADISRMSVDQRHSVVAEIYDRKLSPFRELLGRSDLGVTATEEDLVVIGRYRNDTEIGQEPSHPGVRENPITPYGTGISGVRGWRVENWWFLQKWTGSTTRIIHIREGSYSEVNDFVRDQWSHAWAAYDRALAEYNRSKAQHDARRSRAMAAVFPASAFDRLREQVNGFFLKIVGSRS
ncbi:MAG: hypothetical protein LBG20_01085 [Holosporaceae bacterium]|nr:hypothetical protein [Holosporaceae bacterium]